MKKIVLLVLLVFSNLLVAQLETTSFEALAGLQTTQKRNVIVFIHTDWCQYCQAMLQSTFKDNKVIEALNKNFYFIALNAEEKRTIRFNNQMFNYKPTGESVGVHELAVQLRTQKKLMSYPVLCILNPENEIIYQESQYRNAKDLVYIMDKIRN